MPPPCPRRSSTWPLLAPAGRSGAGPPSSRDERAGRVVAAAEAGVAAVEKLDLARLLTREHGKTHLEAIFDTATMAGMASAFAPLVAQALAPRDLVGGATRIEWVPHGVVAAVLPFNWPVSVMANKVLPALLAGDTVVVKAPPTCPGTVLRVAAAMAAVLPPGVLNVVNGPEAALGAALVSHPDVDMVSFTGGVGTGQAVMAAAAATTRPVVLELGGNDAAILAPDVAGDAALAARIVDAAFVTSGQVCMAIKRLYVHRDRLDETVDALAGRLAAEVVGDGLADGVTMGPVHTAAGARPGRGARRRGSRARSRVLRPGRMRPEDEGSGGYFVFRRSWWPRTRTPASCARSSSPPRCRSSPTTTSTGGRRSQRHNVRPVRLGLEQRRRAGRRRGVAALGGHGVRQRPRPVGHRHGRPDGRVEAVRLRGRAGGRGHAGLRPSAGPGAPARTGRAARSSS